MPRGMYPGSPFAPGSPLSPLAPACPDRTTVTSRDVLALGAHAVVCTSTDPTTGATGKAKARVSESPLPQTNFARGRHRRTRRAAEAWMRCRQECSLIRVSLPRLGAGPTRGVNADGLLGGTDSTAQVARWGEC